MWDECLNVLMAIVDVRSALDLVDAERRAVDETHSCPYTESEL
jgi:hypothetical protein